MTCDSNVCATSKVSIPFRTFWSLAGLAQPPPQRAGERDETFLNRARIMGAAHRATCTSFRMREHNSAQAHTRLDSVRLSAVRGNEVPENPANEGNGSGIAAPSLSSGKADRHCDFKKSFFESRKKVPSKFTHLDDFALSLAGQFSCFTRK
jgi:hypothetical protein